MAIITGGSFKEISPDDIKVRTTELNQLIDVIQEDISGSITRKSYQVFVTGGVGPGVTSSLFQTVFDQDFTLQTANPIFDVTIGLSEQGNTVVNSSTGQEASSGKLLFSEKTVMMREKIDIYRQYASNLLGNANARFTVPFGDSDSPVNEAVFLSFKRLFARDQVKRETFAIRMFRSASFSLANDAGVEQTYSNATAAGRHSNIDKKSNNGQAIFTDIGAASNQRRTFGGEVANIVNASNTAEEVGLIFYDSGTVVLDAAKVFSGSQHMSGTISGMFEGLAADTSRHSGATQAGETIMGSPSFQDPSGQGENPNGRQDATLIPDLFVSASIDDIVDHICETRFGDGSLTSITFQNITNINSTLIFCRASADEFNYSSNPTFKDSAGRINVVDAGQEETQRSFVFPTTVGLHDEQGRLLAVAKTSRPIEKNDEKDITFRVRLDF